MKKKVIISGYYGFGNIGVFPKKIPTHLAIITIPWGSYYSKPLKIMTSTYVRHSPKETIYGTKISGNYANSILAMYEARKKGYDEALMLDSQGYVSEGPAENIFIIKKNALIDPLSSSALPGITRASIIELSKDLGIHAYQKKIRLKEVKNADELFYCGTATEIAPIVSVDGKTIGNGKAGALTSKIKFHYYNIVHAKVRKYKKWLTYID